MSIFVADAEVRSVCREDKGRLAAYICGITEYHSNAWPWNIFSPASLYREEVIRIVIR